MGVVKIFKGWTIYEILFHLINYNIFLFLEYRTYDVEVDVFFCFIKLRFKKERAMLLNCFCKSTDKVLVRIRAFVLGDFDFW